MLYDAKYVLNLYAQEKVMNGIDRTGYMDFCADIGDDISYGNISNMTRSGMPLPRQMQVFFDQLSKGLIHKTGNPQLDKLITKCVKNGHIVGRKC
jgi:hypothetical protein